MRGLCAQDIMSRAPLVTLEPEQNIGELVKYLELYPRLADYPVVDSSRGGVYLGVITRCDILILLTKRGLFYEKEKKQQPLLQKETVGASGSVYDEGEKQQQQQQQRRQRRVALKFEELIHEKVKKDNIDLDTVLTIVTPEDRDNKDLVLNITPYLEIGHYTINRFASVHRTFQLFRSLGLRDLVVTDAFGRPMGVITRHDLKLLEEVGIDEAYYKSRHDSDMDNNNDASYQDLR